MRYIFCTYFDHNYLPRGLVLYETLQKHSPESVLYVLALSHECERVLQELALPNLHIVPLHKLEAHDTELYAVKNTRSRIEYYFTISPCFPLYLFETCLAIELLTYIDADCALFSDPTPVLTEMESLSVGMVGHRFVESMRHAEIYGKYNVGWLSFKRDADGLGCLRWWRERCLEWCEDRLDGERFADQKYLDRWPELFRGVHELQHRGVNVAPWNAARYSWVYDGQYFTVDDEPLVCYHFHGCKRVAGPFWDTGLDSYKTSLNKTVNTLYKKYITVLLHKENLVRPYLQIPSTSIRYVAKGNIIRRFVRTCRTIMRLVYRRALLWV